MLHQSHIAPLTSNLLNKGRAAAIAQFGELFQGVARDAHGRLHRCLLSLPCDSISAAATFSPTANGTVTVDPASKVKAARAAQLALEFLGSIVGGGALWIESDIPEAKGCGSSTADCVAAVLAVAAAIGRPISEHDVAQLVVAAEHASGNIMFERAVLFAHREGKPFEEFHCRLPRMRVLGFDTNPPGLVDTLEFPRARYALAELEQLHVLVAALRRAIRTSDARLLGRVATASATINQRFLPTYAFDEIHRIATAVGALGVAVAHSGTVAALLFDPDDGHHRAADDAANLLASVGIDNVLHFYTG